MSDDPDRRAAHTALILVVERDPHVRELEAFFLEKAGYVVEFAQDGARALEMVESLGPEIVITEVLVPKLDGLSLCRRIKEHADLGATKVLIFSFLAVSERAREARADAFLRKPLAEQKLVHTVGALLDLHRRVAR